MSKNLAEESMPTLGISFSVVFTYYVSQRGEGVFKMLMHDYVGGGGGWLYGDISK